MNPDLDKLHPYPFEKLAALKAEVSPAADKHPIALSIGEPKHQPPSFVLQALQDNLAKLANYPSTKGALELRQTIAQWLTQRFSLAPQSLDAERHILPVNGTREALFALVQALIDRHKKSPLVLCPNPFYQIYEGAALLAGAEPYFLNCSADNGYQPDYDQVPKEVWQRCQLLFICTPGNPTGAVMSSAQLQQLIKLADEYDFIIASDECYSELYFDEQNPPPGLLQACADMGRNDYQRCVVFHSLSKRSNLPGLRSGFVAGDAHIMAQFLRYRTYHGCAMALPSQIASIAAWSDEQHVQQNRLAYQDKFRQVLDILAGHLDVSQPDAGFYLWPKIHGCDKAFAQRLFAEQHITVLPGQFLARQSDGVNPGAGHVRMALVAPIDECVTAAQRIVEFVS